jgi:hypothetical protein
MDDLDDQLVAAAEKGDTQEVKRLIAAGAKSLNFALVWASKRGRNEVAEILLDAGADIHAQDDFAVRMAATEGPVSTIKLLMSRGADIHVGNNWALRSAAVNGQRDNSIFLMRCGCDAQQTFPDDDMQDFRLFRWLDEVEATLSRRFVRKPLRKQCFDESGELQEDILDACVTRQFNTLIAVPLLSSGASEDRKLFSDVWEQLPAHWQVQYQNSYMQFMKQGGLADHIEAPPRQSAVAINRAGR